MQVHTAYDLRKIPAKRESKNGIDRPILAATEDGAFLCATDGRAATIAPAEVRDAPEKRFVSRLRETPNKAKSGVFHAVQEHDAREWSFLLTEGKSVLPIIESAEDYAIATVGVKSLVRAAESLKGAAGSDARVVLFVPKDGRKSVLLMSGAPGIEDRAIAAVAQYNITPDAAPVFSWNKIAERVRGILKAAASTPRASA